MDAPGHDSHDNALQARTEQLAAIQNINAEIARELDLPTLLTLIHRRATELLGTGMGTVCLWDEKNQVLVPRVWHGHKEPWREFRPRLGEGVAGTVAQTRSGLIVNDFRTSPYATRALLAHTSHVGVLAEPLLYRGELLGVISVDTADPARHFTPEDQQLLRLFAGQAAIAIQNARLFGEAEAGRTEAEVFGDLVRTLNTSLDLDRVLQQVAEAAKKVCECDLASIAIRDDRSGDVVLRYRAGGYRGDLVGYAIAPGQGIGGTVLATGLPFRTARYTADPRISKDFVAITEAEGVQAELAVPIRIDTAVEGVLFASNRSPRPFNDRDQTFLQRLADHAAVAIRNARLFAAAQSELQDRTRAEAALRTRTARLEAIRAVAQEITHELDLTRLLNLFIARAAALIGASSGTVYLVAPAGDELLPAAWHGLGDWQGGLRLAFGQGIAGMVAQTRKSLLVNDYRNSPYAHPVTLARTQITASLGEPLLYRDRIIGAITLSDDAGRVFTADDQEVLRLFAVQAAVAIENARLYEATQKRGEQLEALLGASRSMMAALDLPTTLARIAESAAQIAQTPHAKVALWGAGAGVLRVAACVGTATPVGTEISVEGTLSGLVVRDGAPVFSADCRNDPRNAYAAADQAQGLVTSLNMPIMARGTLVGVLAFNTTHPKTYTATELTYLTSFADQAALAIENARLFQQELTRRTQIETVRAVAAEIARELDLNQLLALIMHQAIALLGGASGTIYLLDAEAEHLMPRAWEGLDDWVGGIQIPLGSGLVGTVAANRLGTIENAYRTSGRVLPLFLERTAISAAVLEPLLFRSDLLGVIAVNYEDPQRRVTEEDARLLELFADHAAIAIANARLYTDLHQSYNDLQRAQAELVQSEKLRALGQMAAGIAHDLNNMLAVVLGQAELLRLQVADPAVQKALQPLETAATDGAQVVRRLQAFAHQQPSGPLQPCDLDALVREAVELTRPRWKDEPLRQGRQIEVQVGLEEVPPVLGHPAEIREVITNLILNAVDALPQGGRIRFGGTRAEGHVYLTVADTGIGMSEVVRARLFEPFFTTKGGQGTGLGLAVAYGIMERHGGNITAQSTPGQGSTFTLRFRVARAARDESGAAPGPAAITKRRILLIDDDPAVRTTLATMLRAAGHDVDEATDGTAGLARLEAGPVDVLLTDLGMPGMTGWDVARAVKSRAPQIPIILLTGWGERHAKEIGDGPVDQVLGKPVRLPDLLAAIGRVTATASAATEPAS